MYILVIIFFFVVFISLLSAGPPDILPPVPVCEFSSNDQYIGMSYVNETQAINGEGCEGLFGFSETLIDKDTSEADLIAFLNVRRGMGKCRNFELWARHLNGTVGVLTPTGYKLNSDPGKRIRVLCKKHAFVC